MKKALVILMALSMVFAAFADEPTVKNEIASFEGNATVDWGVNLDSGKTGFKNSEEATLKFDLIGTGDKSTTGEGIWGEIKVKIADDPVQYKNGALNEKTAAIDFAKIHLLDNMLAIGIRSGDNKYGKYEPAVAVHNYVKDRKVDGASANTGDGIQGAEVGGTVTDGITIEFTHDLLDLNIDFRSAGWSFASKSYKDFFGGDYTAPDPKGKTWAEYWALVQADSHAANEKQLDAYNAWAKANATDAGQYTNNYGMGVDVNVKVVPNLSLKAGFGMDFFGKNPMGLFAAAEYKAAIDDTFYLKPQVAFTMGKPDKDKDASLAIVGALMFGWGADDKADPIKFVDGKVRNGFSVATNINLTPGKNADGSDKAIEVPLCIGVYDSTFVENLKVGAELHSDNVAKFADTKYYVAFDCSYKIDTITPTFALKIEKGDFYLYGAVAYTGITNTKLTLAYTSGNLTASKAGTINLSAKIHF